jgi:hypothetical protein
MDSDIGHFDGCQGVNLEHGAIAKLLKLDGPRLGIPEFVVAAVGKLIHDYAAIEPDD